jgi:hypothetical protein
MRLLSDLDLRPALKFEIQPVYGYESISMIVSIEYDSLRNRSYISTDTTDGFEYHA